MSLSLPEQRALKAARIARALNETESASATLAPLEVTESPQAYGYRTRARLAFRRVQRGVVIGYHAPSSHEIVDAPDCAVLAPPLEQALQAARAQLGALVGEGELQLGLGADGAAVLCVTCSAPQPPAVYEALQQLATGPALAGTSLTVQGGAPATFGIVEQESGREGGLPVRGPGPGFAQANAALNAMLVEHVIEEAQAAGLRVLELFAGHGNFTLGLARAAADVIAVESDRAACDAMHANLRARGLSNVRVRAEPASKVAAERGPVDVVVLDPPRAGAKEVLVGVTARNPRRIVYISCDPGTLRRDLSRLRELGYAPIAARGFDMFPHTPHVEAVVTLERAGKG